MIVSRQYGFDDKTIQLLIKLRNMIDLEYQDLNSAERDWYFARLIGSITYANENEDYENTIDRQKWAGTAGYNLVGETFRESMLKLGISAVEYNYLYYMVRIQHTISGGKVNISTKELLYYKQNMETGLGKKLTNKEFQIMWNQLVNRMAFTGDYVHQQITIAAILNPQNGTSIHWIAKKYTNTDEEGIRNLAGWLGDATIKGKDGHTSFGNDDYIADLDAANITSIMKKKKVTYREAARMYRKLISGGKTRATVFCEEYGYKNIEKTVLQRLGYSQLEDLKMSQPDTYRFLVCLQQGKHEMK